jgi:hypothetical protein
MAQSHTSPAGPVRPVQKISECQFVPPPRGYRQAVEVQFGPGHDCGRRANRKLAAVYTGIVSGWPTDQPDGTGAGLRQRAGPCSVDSCSKHSNASLLGKSQRGQNPVFRSLTNCSMDNLGNPCDFMRWMNSAVTPWFLSWISSSSDMLSYPSRHNSWMNSGLTP